MEKIRKRLAMFLLQKLEDIVLQKNDTKMYIADFLLKERKNIKNFSMQQVADITYTSKPTLVRFAKSLNYKGWKDFIVDFIQEVYQDEKINQNINPNFPFTEDDSIETIIENLKELQIGSIKDTAANIQSTQLEYAKNYLLSARHIIIFGMSPNSILGELFKRKMESIGILIMIATLDEGGTLARALSKEDCAIIVSYSGNNELREPMRYIPELKSNGVKLIGITSGGDNYISQMVDCVLQVSSRERLYSKISGFTTEESIHFIFNLLFSVCFSENYLQNYQYKLKNSKTLEYRRRASLHDMREDSKE
ncbi:MurR/RpiR family transcriptional regulator [Streptococcus merionis]|uniref:MurR/RpiR family transcriptional regulator n=1 Tax=Streptococcus merionis TaxID=400065 RepID=UPI003514299E